MNVFSACVIFLTLILNFEASLSSRVIIIEEAKACFRRALSGKRVSHSLVRKVVTCERLEDCMRECAEERQFACEGFNYRVPPLGKSQGECELLELPLQQLNLRRDIIENSEYDYYERDRNIGPDCRSFTIQEPDFRPYDNRGYRARGDKNYRDGYGPFQESHGHKYYYDRINRYYEDYEPPVRPPPRYDSDRYRPNNYPPYEEIRPPYVDDRRRGYNYYSRHGSHIDEYNYHNYSEEERYKYDRPFFPFPTRAPSHLPEGVGASRTKPPSQEITPPVSTTYLPSSSASDSSPIDHISSTPPTYSSPERDRGIPIPVFPEDRRKSLLPPAPPQLYHRQPSIYFPEDFSRRLPGRSYTPHHEIPYDYKSYEPFLFPRKYWRHDDYFKDRNFFWDNYFHEREKDWKYWGFDRSKSYRGGSYGNFGKPYGYFGIYRPLSWNDYNNKKYYRPYIPSHNPKEWSAYGGLYGYGGQKHYYDYHKNSYKYWGLSKYDDQHYFSTSYSPYNNEDYRPPNGIYYHESALLPSMYLFDYGTDQQKLYANDYFVHKACSLRMASGFKLHRYAVKIISTVKDIYECELLCYKESTFVCSSYAYRYTQGPSVPPENCYLSDRGYKNLDYYTDLEPDRNFDVYTMNNRDMCYKLFASSPDYSDCFWRVRSGVRLDHSVVRDSLTCQSLLECQLECLNARRFTCRAFSFRFETSVPGGSIDNCQLTDWPFLELNPRLHLVQEPGFELYDRGSFGHGCEPFHFRIGSRRNTTSKNMDELCYVGYGTPAKILPIAAKSSVRVEDDLECRRKCTEARDKLLFHCMSYSFRTNVPDDSTNCDLSDINQSDLLPNIDYVLDEYSSLYAWNDYDPECAALVDTKDERPRPNENDITLHSHAGAYPLDTWRLFSVSGWPCRSLSKQNKEAGFWFCEIEGAVSNSWDYCCRPDHQCGFSEGYPYQWCYVGPKRTQWRKCSDKYYPYARNVIIRIPGRSELYLPELKPLYSNLIVSPHSPLTSRFRPDRPPPVVNLPPYKSLDEYEREFDAQFLDKTQSDILGESKHWPVSYLHKEMPLNETNSNISEMKENIPSIQKEGQLDSKYEAISNLIDVIKQEELNDIKYQIGNRSENSNEILVVEIPLPSNFTGNNTQLSRSDMKNEQIMREVRKLKSMETVEMKGENKPERNIKPVYSRGYVTKTTKPYFRN